VFRNFQMIDEAATDRDLRGLPAIISKSSAAMAARLSLGVGRAVGVYLDDHSYL
jgi:hypothetical protein